MTATQPETSTLVTLTPGTTRGDHFDVADRINELAERAARSGAVLEVSGRRIDLRYGSPARAWNTGSVSIRTRANKGSGTCDVWFKTGQTAQITVNPVG